MKNFLFLPIFLCLISCAANVTTATSGFKIGLPMSEVIEEYGQPEEVMREKNGIILGYKFHKPFQGNVYYNLYFDRKNKMVGWKENIYKTQSRATANDWGKIDFKDKSNEKEKANRSTITNCSETSSGITCETGSSYY